MAVMDLMSDSVKFSPSKRRQLGVLGKGGEVAGVCQTGGLLDVVEGVGAVGEDEDSTAPPANTAHQLKNPNRNGQISTPFSLYTCGFSSYNQSNIMNSSHSNADPSDIGLNNPRLGSGKPEFGSALGRSKPRMVKLRRHAASNHPRSTLSSETGNIDPGFNPFRPVSDNSISSFSQMEMGSSFSGNLNFGNAANDDFVFGASPEKSTTNLDSKVGNSSGFVENVFLDDMRKLKIGHEQEFVSKLKIGHEQEFVSNINPSLNLNASDRDSSSHAKLPDEMRKLNIEGSSNVESSKNVKNVNSNLNAHNMTHFMFGSGNNVTNSFGTSVASELPTELKKLNIKDAGEVDGSNLNCSADDKKSAFGYINKCNNSLDGSSANMLPDKMKNLNMKDSLNTYVGEKEEVNFTSSDKSGFQRRLGIIIIKDRRVLVPLHLLQRTVLEIWVIRNSRILGAISFTAEFTFQAGLQGQSFSGSQVPQEEYVTPNQKGNIFTCVDKKLEFSAKRESVKDARSKKKRGKLRIPTPVQPWLGQDFSSRKSSSQERADSFESYSPMDVSPYQETLADNRGSREPSVTSEEAFHSYVDNASSKSHPTVSNDAADEDLVVATQCLDINEGDVKCTEMKVEGSQYMFGKRPVAEGPSGEPALGSETDSFQSAAEQLDYSTDTFVTAADSEVSSSLRIENQDIDGKMQFSFASASEDGSFTFAASSSAQGQSSAAMRHHKKKNRIKVVNESYSSLPNTKVSHTASSTQFLPHSESSSLLSPRRGQKGDLPISFSKRGDRSNFEVVKEQETKQETISTPAASIATQEACEKWRLRGNQAYGNGDMSRAEDYYTQGVNCVPQNENSRGCLRALMLCYSNRAATRMSLGKMREALADCMKAAVIDPNFLRVQVRAANCYLALGEVEDASIHFIKCFQSGSDACVDRKLVLEASEGLEKVQKVSECMKQSAEHLQRRTSSDAESALGLISEALMISSHCEKLFEMKADALFMLRKYEEMIQLCEQTLGSAEMNCSAVVSADGHITNLDSSDARKPPSFRLWRWRLIIQSYFYLGRLEEALEFLKKQEESVSTTEENGCKTLESLIPLAATIRELVVHKASGNEAFQSGRHAEAVECYTAALSCTVESRPFAAVCFCNRAAAYKAMGQIIDAIADCSLAIALDGNYLKAISRRSTLFEMIRDYEQATMDLQRLVSLLMKQVEDKANQSSASDRMSSVNELRQAQQRLSIMEEEARKEIPLNMYLILGVDPSVTASEIKKAYRKAALRHHPDKAGQSLTRSENGDDGLWKEVVDNVHKDADRLFKMIGEAYAVLSDPTKRSRYDLEEEMRNAQKRGSGGSSSKMHADAQNYPFERSSSNRRQWREVWRSHGNSQPRGSETTRPSRFS
ncbi:uncharacterized protein LOC114318429 [Camellia sinensis]|uniref:uncharacterized protein LOC114318429 n=1 Tax=Camellia sinensis TaxID=4442 RepID=UPI00103660E3|nr:uncharacterized protein LOC114318429 [Camellia sinensis]